jgi:Asp-tRNA(Asn)/Glu-tRNA(Gln) amidotransferase C subunit
MLPVELLRHIFSFAIGDTECPDTFNYQRDGQERYKLEILAGRKEIETKRALLLVSSIFHTIVEEFAWSWITISSFSRLLQVDSILRGSGEYYRRNPAHSFRRRRPARWIQRIDVKLTTNHAEDATAVRKLMHVLTSCPNLKVFIIDIIPLTSYCRPMSTLVTGALIQLTKLRRLEFIGCKGPTMKALKDLIPHLKNLEQLDTGRMEESKAEVKQLLVEAGIREGHTRVRSDETQDGKSARGRRISLPKLYALKISSYAQSSWLTLFNHISLPSLTHLTIHHVDFRVPAIQTFFHSVGLQLTHLYTIGVRGHDGLEGFATLLSLCPKLQHLTFSSLYSYHRYGESWKHPSLQSIGLQYLVPLSASFEEDELGDEIRSTVKQVTTHVVKSRTTGELPMMTTIRMEDRDPEILKYARIPEEEWEVLSQSHGLRLEDVNGKELLKREPKTAPKSKPTDDLSDNPTQSSSEGSSGQPI